MAILVIDDEVVIQQMIAATVEDMGYDALMADNGQAALELLSNISTLPQLIISDLMMPRMDGVAFARQIKHDCRYQNVAIVLMSAAFQTHYAPEIDHFLPKPFELDTIEQLVIRYAGVAHRQPPELTMPDLTRRSRDYQGVPSKGRMKA